MAGNVNDDVSSVMNIGFDMIAGPMVRWKKEIDAKTLNIDYDQFALATYLAFKGGNGGSPTPQAIVYDSFSVVGFPKGMDLICLFLKTRKSLEDMARLKNLAESISAQMENDESADGDAAGTSTGADDDGVKEIKRIICNMLRKTTLPTPEIRSHFKLASSEIWAIMSDLEHANLVKRAGKDGRSVVWTLA